MKEKLREIYEIIDNSIDDICNRICKCENCPIFNENTNRCAMGEFLEIIEEEENVL